MESDRTISIGTAGWALPAAAASEFPGSGTHLERYARVFNCAEINSTFYRAHRPSTYERWAACVPEHFQFSVKLRRTITHERKLVDCDVLVREFIDEVAALGSRRGPLLVQLPPSLAYDRALVEPFLAHLRTNFKGTIALEPRHTSWFTSTINDRLRALGVSRVAADPAVVNAAASPGGDLTVRYYRWHGSPATYWSSYDGARLTALWAEAAASPGDVWCVFDNTAQGAASENALALCRLARVQ